MIKNLSKLYWSYLIMAPKNEPHRSAYLAKLNVSGSVYGAIAGMSFLFSLIPALILYFTTLDNLSHGIKLAIYILALFVINPAVATIIHLIVKRVNATL